MDKITHNGVTVAFRINNTVTVSEKAFNALDGVTRGNILSSLTSTPSNISFITDFSSFENINLIIKKVQDGDPDVNNLLAYHGLSLPPELVSARHKYIETLKPFINKLEGMRSIYKLAPLPPEGWETISLSPGMTNVKYNGYSIKTYRAKKLWLAASGMWFSGKNGVLPNIIHEGYSRGVILSSGDLKIGCQTIPRYAVEQFALEMGWPFPS